MNVDRAKRALTDNTALSPRQQQHARTVWHPKTTTQRSSLCMGVKLRKRKR